MALDIYADRTAEEILDDMLDNVSDTLDKREGGIIYDTLAPSALEIEMLGYELDAILELGFVDSSEADFLTRRCAEMGVDRKQGEFATATIIVEAPAGVEIEAGSLFYTDGDLAFASNEYVEVDDSGIAEIDVTATETGADYNVGIGEINRADALVENVTSVRNAENAEGGVDEETDDALRDRYYLKVRSPVTSGNIYHYQTLATEVTGVGSAVVYPVYNGPGTVKVVIANERGGAVTSDVVNACQAHIDSEAIIGAIVTVVGVTEMLINIDATITVSTGNNVEDVKTAIRASLIEYLAQASEDGIVRLSQVGNAIIDVDGVLDYEDLTINGASANIRLDNEMASVIGEVILNVAD